jgi:hypothetical protein
VQSAELARRDEPCSLDSEDATVLFKSWHVMVILSADGRRAE